MVYKVITYRFRLDPGAFGTLGVGWYFSDSKYLNGETS
jgi:hypothetical protein